MLEDSKIRKYLNARLAKASVSRVVIERTLKLITITVCTSRPGIIIGKGGQEVDKLKEELKKITDKEVQTLTSLVNAEDGQIVSKTLAQNEAVSVTLFAFAKGEEISTHDSTGDAMVTVLEGTGRFTVDGIEHLVHAGEVLVMPAKKPHAVFAPEAFKWMLTVIFPFD